MVHGFVAQLFHLQNIFFQDVFIWSDYKTKIALITKITLITL